MGRVTPALDLDRPIIGAPMAGGPSGPALVAAVSRAGGLGFLGAGYKTVDVMADQIRVVRASGVAFGVNVFAPNPVPISASDYAAYAARIAPDAARYGIDTASIELRDDDDQWYQKIDQLLADPVPMVTFTFGCPDASVITALRAAGTTVGLTVTSPAEAEYASSLGPDVLLVQSVAAGGHSGTFTPQRAVEPVALPDLIRAVQAVIAQSGRGDIVVIGAGGVADSADVRAAMAAGAAAVAVGTLLLLTDESEASAVHKAAISEAVSGETDVPRTVITRAFTGRPARALRNEFTDAHSAAAPLGYPALHHLTSPMRRAAAAAGDGQRVNLWAGTGHRSATTGPAADVVARLTKDL
jgi:nitronate monooxygenase